MTRTGLDLSGAVFPAARGRRCKEAGLDVPKDIAVAGFDDILIARYVTPPLSTVQVRIADLGRIALERLAALLNPADTAPASVQTLGCEIVIRETCGGSASATAPRKRRRTPNT